MVKTHEQAWFSATQSDLSSSSPPDHSLHGAASLPFEKTWKFGSSLNFFLVIETSGDAVVARRPLRAARFAEVE
jgi:hypothetical protein